MSRKNSVYVLLSVAIIAVTVLAIWLNRFGWPRQQPAAVSDSSTIPPVEHFNMPAVGTPIPEVTGAHYADMPPGTGGVLYLNSLRPIQVAVNETIVTILPGQGFLFILPPGNHEFYIYGMIDKPVSKTERVEAGKVVNVQLYPTAK
jgi:hypothetical protein